MTKSELIANIKRDRAALEALVARVGEDRLSEPSLGSGWSVKDVLAHITAWEQLCLKWLRTGQREELSVGDEFGAQVDALNARLYEENRTRPLDDVRSAFASSHREIEAAAHSLTDADLAAKPDWAPHAELWRIISSNSDEHYREHIDQIERWLGRGAA